ncbi:MAG TPA: hypothetical protein VNH41_08535 [Steroidobacteraceae bacterium]|nr:hypothetical protein [Steroidobacteraceae bacterium]
MKQSEQEIAWIVEGLNERGMTTSAQAVAELQTSKRLADAALEAMGERVEQLEAQLENFMAWKATLAGEGRSVKGAPMPAEQDDLSTWQPGIDYPEAVTAERDERIAELEAELLAAQERYEEFKHVAMKEAELAQEERDSHAKAASEAMAREKALRDRVEAVREQMHGPLREKLWEVLAGSPSEKPGSALLESAQGLSEPGMADAD